MARMAAILLPLESGSRAQPIALTRASEQSSGPPNIQEPKALQRVLFAKDAQLHIVISRDHLYASAMSRHAVRLIRASCRTSYPSFIQRVEPQPHLLQMKGRRTKQARSKDLE
ncbi:hypothetical protein HDK77DRAFT_58699 [Phyllosticta capitalensis]|uniref:uncharacterized protein n=1 Tax=Phyllosticta capitalensis TaxID=121624 RepID=UPI00312D4332